MNMTMKENASYLILSSDEGEPITMCGLSPNHRGDMSRAQPASLRSFVSRTEHPNRSAYPDDADAWEPEEIRFTELNEMMWWDDGQWRSQIDTGVLGDGWELADLLSQVVWNPDDKSVLRRTLMGNWNIDYRTRFASDACLSSIEKNMPLVFSRIADNWDRHMRDRVHTDLVHLTVMQVLGTDDGGYIYGRVFQPKGASQLQTTMGTEDIDAHTILAYLDNEIAEEVQRGDIMVVPVGRWNGSGFVLDAVRNPEQSSIPPLVFGADQVPNNDQRMVRWNGLYSVNTDVQSRYLANHADSQIPPQCFGRWDDGFIYQSKYDAHAFGIALTLMTENCQGMVGDVSASTADLFVPAWKDKRGVKVIDHAGLFPAHYHDEIRCSMCNGRVLIKMKADNKLTKAPCPHCGSELQFPHLSNTDTVKTVGDNE
jgi:hypothetical protein